MTDKEVPKLKSESKPASITAVKSKKSQPAKKSLAYGNVKFKILLSNGKWRFINKTEVEKAGKKKEIQNRLKLKQGKPLKKRVTRPAVIVKPIKGEKNGETRRIHLKRKNYYPSTKSPKDHRSKGCYRQHKRNFRSSLTPGTILILLAGVNKGKRVVLLKCLSSGLLLVTGPYRLNGVPLRRVQPCHVIATKTKLDISNIPLENIKVSPDAETPVNLDDRLFKRVITKKKVKKGEKSVFVTKKENYRPTKVKKDLQKIIDEQVLNVIKKLPEKKLMYAYLASMFSLRNNQYPHRMQF